MPAGQQASESFVDMLFPTSGIDLARGFQRQRQGTTPTGNNVRSFEPLTQRARGGARSGLLKYLPVQPNLSNFIQELATLVGVGFPAPGGGVQTSTSGRVVCLVAVSGGNVYVTNPGSTTWTIATNNSGTTPPLNSGGIVQSAANNQKLWFADGTHWRYYDPSTNIVFRWDPSAGILPVDLSFNTPRLICTWRGRTVVSGLLKDPQNWFMSAVGDPTNFDYSPVSVTPTQAVAGNNSTLGLIGDVVTSLIPYSDDILIFGGDHTIWRTQGDPMAGGQIDLVSDSIGMAWGNPWCRGPDGTLYFVSNRTGIYSMVPGQSNPERISQQIEQLLLPINTGSNTIRLIWDDRFQGLHVFITPTATATAATHFFWESRSNAWWTDTFGNNNHNPLCCCVFDGNLPGDRVPLIGSWDGFIRSIDPTATTDDGTAIASTVVLGPLLTTDLDMVLIKDIQGVLGVGSGNVTFQVYVGASAEIALAAGAVASGTLAAGRNLSNHIRRSGHAVWLKLTASSPWALEAIRARVAGKGKVQRRGV